MTEETLSPFTGDGVQGVIVYVPGWASPCYIFAERAQEVESRMLEYCDGMDAYAYDISVTFYGYDPRVLGDDGEIIGTDGYPDYVGEYDSDSRAVAWQHA